MQHHHHHHHLSRRLLLLLQYYYYYYLYFILLYYYTTIVIFKIRRRLILILIFFFFYFIIIILLLLFSPTTTMTTPKRANEEWHQMHGCNMPPKHLPQGKRNCSIAHPNLPVFPVNALGADVDTSRPLVQLLLEQFADELALQRCVVWVDRLYYAGFYAVCVALQPAGHRQKAYGEQLHFVANVLPAFVGILEPFCNPCIVTDCVHRLLLFTEIFH